MFYYDDPTPVLEARLEVFHSIEMEEADTRWLYLMCAIGFPILIGASLWWSPLSAGETWKLVVFPAIEVAFVTLWLNSWRRLYKIRRTIRLATQELHTRDDRE